MSPNGRWPPLPFPSPESLDKSAIGLDTGSLVSNKGVCGIVCHAVILDEVGDYDGGTAGYALLTMDQHVLSAPQRLLDILASAFEMALQICTGHIDNIDPVALESVFFRKREPGYVQDLYEVGDILFVERRLLHCSG